MTVRIFSDPCLHHIFESENFTFPILHEKYPNLGSEMWKVKLQKIVGNLLVLDKVQKIIHEWNGHLETFRRPQVIENFR